MPTDNRAHLFAATRRRAEDTRARARAALRRLDRAGVPITFVSVAEAAAVSRALLYRDPDLRAEIERLRTAARPERPHLPATQRTSDASLRQRLDGLHDEVRNLRTENHELRQHIERVLGEQRAATTQPREHGRTIGPCN